MDALRDDSAPDSRADSWVDSWPAHVAMAVGTGVVTTYLPVQRWSRPARWALHGGLGLLGAGAVAYGVTRPGGPESPDATDVRPAPPARPRPASIAAMAVGFGALTAGISRGGEAADAWTEGRLAARGVRRPRLWMGAVAAAASLAMSAADKHRA